MEFCNTKLRHGTFLVLETCTVATVDDDEALEDEAALRAMASGLQTKREATEVAISLAKG